MEEDRIGFFSPLTHSGINPRQVIKRCFERCPKVSVSTVLKPHCYPREAYIQATHRPSWPDHAPFSTTIPVH